MDILMVAGELAPYARATSAGDTVAELCRALSQLGHDVTVALPRYSTFEEHGLLLARRLTPLPLGDGSTVTVFDGQLASGVKIVLFDQQDLFNAPGVFGEDGAEYPNNAVRFGVLCQAAAAVAVQRKEAGKAFDVVHVHDWEAAPVALLLKRLGASGTPTVLTVHDSEALGLVASKELTHFGLPAEEFTDAVCQVGARASLLKAGITSAKVVTVASTMDAERLTAEDSAVRTALTGTELVTIRSGVDYGVFNPATDAALVTRYDATLPEVKSSNKAGLCKTLELDLELTRPLVVVFAQASRAGGLDVVTGCLGDLLRQDVTLVLVAMPTSGESAKAALRAAGAKKYTTRDSYRFVEAPSPELFRRLLAAADFAVLPGTEQTAARWARQAQRYGAVPVCRSEGAAVDVVVNADASLESGDGFLFSEAEGEGVVAAVGRALAAYERDNWVSLVKRVMRKDLSWDRAARRYVQVFRHATGGGQA